MSKPSSSMSVLKTSVLLSPLLNGALTSHAQLQSLFETSCLVHGIQKLQQCIFNPIHRAVENITWLHHGLFVLHVLSLMGVLLLTTFASTNMIAASVVGAFLILLLRLLTKPIRIQLTMVDVLVSVFFLTAILATAFSSYLHTSVIGLAKFMVFYLGFWNFRLLIGENRSALLWFLGALMILGLGESLVGFYQHIHHVQPLATWQDPSVNPEDQLTRIFGTLQPSNPNLLAGFLIPCLTAGIGLKLLSLTTTKKWLALPVSGINLLMLAALVMTGSRGGYLAILVMAVTMFLMLGHLLWHEPALKTHHKLKAAWVLAGISACAAVVFALAFLSPIRNRFLSIFAMREDSSNSYRLNVWASVWKMIKDNWWMGIGPGNNTFKLVYGLYMVPGYNALSAYSIFLEMWVEQGILGLLAFLCMLVMGFLRTLVGFYSAAPLANKLLLGTLFTGILGSVVYGLFDTIWYRPSVNLLFWLLVAGLSVSSEEALSFATL